MGTNTLTNRTNGQTIVESFFNDLNTAFNGDFVGRNASGVAAAGQNLGTVALPWSTVRTDSLILNGSAVDPSQLTAPQNRVISGKTRSSSNQPAYIVPNGAAASFLIDGTPTNLVVDINGSSVTINTDITKSSLTTAPATQNTALVNDTDAADQHDTRLWGESFHYKSITIDTVGTNITALIGKFASFKIYNGSDTEYFFAFVESATKLSKIYRGFFYNSSSAPINRIVFSNNDTITLMNTAWAFIENDGTTCDVTYNNPVWSYTSPNSPVTGDYWYDLANQTWKRYDGAAFQIINRTYIGMAILDSTNCVAARSVDFYANYTPFNTMDLEVSTTEILRAKTQSQRVNVAGQYINFEHSLPTWNITTDLATSADMYNATEQASRMYYLYIKDDGDTVISDIQPYYRYDFYGEYHPHNPWRCVGMAFNNASSDITQVSSKSNNNLEILLTEGNGHGATSTRCRRYTTVVKNQGASMIYIDNANDGSTFECFEYGYYEAVYLDRYSVSASIHGISANADNTDLGTDVSLLPSSKVKAVTFAHTNVASQCSNVFEVKVGEIIRPHDQATQDATTFYESRFAIRKIG